MPLDWITSFHAAQSDGTLPLDGDAGAMRYKRAIIWEIDLLGFGIGGRSVKGSWEITIEAPGGAELFHQVVEMELFFVYLSLPGIAFYTWNFIRDNAAGSATDLIDGQETGDGEIAGFLMTGLVQSSMEPASGQGNTDLTATIVTDWFSPAYLFPSGIPAGSKVVVKADTWGFGPASVEYGWAFGPGQAVLHALTHPPTGQTFLLHVAEGELRVARTRKMQSQLALHPGADNGAPDPLPSCDYVATVAANETAPRFARLYRKNGALYCLALADSLRLWRSGDEGKEWKELADMPAEELNIVILAGALDSTGAALYLYGTANQDEPDAGLESGRPMYAELKNQGHDWKLTARGPVQGENLPTQNIAGLEYAGGTLHLTAKNGANGLQLLTSSDGLRSLKTMEIS